MNLPRTIFRAYDIRGIVGQTLTEDTVFLIGQALGSLVREQREDEICVARDGRLSGPMLMTALCEGLLAAGCDVVDLGMVPTPVLYYATHALSIHSGVVLTGSHNPPEYNGLKMVVSGATLSSAAIQSLYQRILNRQFYVGSPGARRELNIIDRYINAITADVQLARPMKIVIDAGNGVAGGIAPSLFKKLGCEVEALYCEVDGRFPNHHPDPSQAENLSDLIRAVRASQADVGLAFDGDADRLGVVTQAGEIIWPDRLLMLYADALLRVMPGAKVIYDVKCTARLEQYVQERGGESLMWKTGHSLIKAKMQETQALLAGEMSGHFFFKDRWHGGDDGLYAGARLLEILSHAKESSTAMFAALPDSVNTPELKVPILEEEKFTFIDAMIDAVYRDMPTAFQAATRRDESQQRRSLKDEGQVVTLDGLRVNFEEGWGLVRASNTSPCLVLRFEASNQTLLRKIQDQFKAWMQSIRSDLTIPF